MRARNAGLVAAPCTPVPYEISQLDRPGAELVVCQGLLGNAKPGQPTWTRRTIKRDSLRAPAHVWRVMLGRLWAAHAHDAAVVGLTTRHQITE